MRLRDLPWKLAEVLDRVVPGTFAELYRLAGPYSMASSARLRGLYRAVRSVVRRNVPGDVVECGTGKATDAFLGRHAPSIHLRYVDYTGRQVTKPAAPA
jgi:hypothetical protein